MDENTSSPRRVSKFSTRKELRRYLQANSYLAVNHHEVTYFYHSMPKRRNLARQSSKGVEDEFPVPKQTHLTPQIKIIARKSPNTVVPHTRQQTLTQLEFVQISRRLLDDIDLAYEPPQMQSEPPIKKRRISTFDDSTSDTTPRAPKRRSLRLQRLSPEDVDLNVVEAKPKTEKPPNDVANRSQDLMPPPPKTPRKTIERVVPSSQSPIATPLSLRQSPRYFASQSESPLKTRSTNIITPHRVSKADKGTCAEPLKLQVEDTYYEKENSQITTQGSFSRKNSRLDRASPLHSDQDWADPRSSPIPGSSVRARIQRNPQHLTTKLEILNSDDDEVEADESNESENESRRVFPAKGATKTPTPVINRRESNGFERETESRIPLDAFQSAKENSRASQDQTQSQLREPDHAVSLTPKRKSSPHPDSRQQQTLQTGLTHLGGSSGSQKETPRGGRRSIKAEPQSQAGKFTPMLGGDEWYRTVAVNSLEGADLDEVEQPIFVSIPNMEKSRRRPRSISPTSPADRDEALRSDHLEGEAPLDDYEDMPDHPPLYPVAATEASKDRPCDPSQHLGFGANVQSDSQQAAAQLKSEIQWHTQHPGPVVETESQFQDAWRMFSPPQPALNSESNLEKETSDSHHTDREVVLIGSSPPPRPAFLPHNSILRQASRTKTCHSQTATANLAQGPNSNHPTPSQATTASLLSSPTRKDRTPTQALHSSQQTPSSPLETPAPSHNQASPEIIAISSSPILAGRATGVLSRPGRRRAGDATPEHERILRQARENTFLRDLLIKPMTDSQMYPESIMNFELPRLFEQEDPREMRYEGEGDDEEL